MKIIRAFIHFICIGMAVLMLGSCDENKGNQVEYLAVQLEEGDSWSIIDKDGKVVVEEEYPSDADVSAIIDDVYWVKSGDKYQLFSIDSPKKPLVGEEFDNVSSFNQNDLAPVSIHNQPIRIINKKGKTVATLPKSIKRCYCFSKDGFAIFTDKNEKYGVINTKGKIVVKPSYYYICPINEGLMIAAKKEDDKKALILNTSGKKVGEIDLQKYHPVTVSFVEGKIIVKDAKADRPKFYAMNSKGEKLFTIKKAKEIETNYMNGYLVIKDDNGKCGVVDDQGELVIRPKYTILFHLGKDFFIAQKEEKIGIINAKDECVIDFEHDDATQTQLGNHFIMQDGNEYVILDKEGKEYNTFHTCRGFNNLFVEYTEDALTAKEEPQTYDPGMEDDMEGYGTYGLMAALPVGTTKYTGDMGGYPIEFTIVNHPDKGELYANYKNKNYGTTMKMIGESLPADDGAISFTGEENGTHWNFKLDGDANNISGTAYGSNNYQFKVKLKRM